MRYKVLTLTPPWGTLIAISAKKIETRDWSTSYRGPLLIHQGSNLRPIGGKEGFKGICFSEPFLLVLTQAKPNAGGMFYHEDYFFSLPFGAIVAVCELVTCKLIGYDWPDNQLVCASTQHRLTPQERAFGNYSVGRYAWLLADVRALPEPIPARGMPGLWEWEGKLEL